MYDRQLVHVRLLAEEFFICTNDGCDIGGGELYLVGPLVMFDFN